MIKTIRFILCTEVVTVYFKNNRQYINTLQGRETGYIIYEFSLGKFTLTLFYVKQGCPPFFFSGKGPQTLLWTARVKITKIAVPNHLNVCDYYLIVVVHKQNL